MGLLNRLFGHETRSIVPTSDPYLAEFFGQTGSTLAWVDANRASGMAVAHRCISLIAELMASVPLFVYRSGERGNRERASDRHGKMRCYHRATGHKIDLETKSIGSAEFFAECERMQVDFALRRRFIWIRSGFDRDSMMAALEARWADRRMKLAWESVSLEFDRLGQAASRRQAGFWQIRAMMPIGSEKR